MSPAPGAGWDRVPAADALEIGTVLSRCARVVDARAWPDLDRVFTGDAVVVSPGFFDRALQALEDQADVRGAAEARREQGGISHEELMAELGL